MGAREVDLSGSLKSVLLAEYTRSAIELFQTAGPVFGIAVAVECAESCIPTQQASVGFEVAAAVFSEAGGIPVVIHPSALIHRKPLPNPFPSCSL